MTIEPGQKIGRLTILERKPGSRWLCQCDCGELRTVRTDRFKAGLAKSCGCLRRDSFRARITTHGKSKNSRAYVIWQNLIQRCTNPKNTNFKNYGGRGIAICDRWRQFENFFADMGEPGPKLTLERNNNDGPYHPNNCRWATRKEQLNNSRHNRRLTYMGETLTLTQWAVRIGITYQAMQKRLRRHKLDSDKAFRPRSI